MYKIIIMIEGEEEGSTRRSGGRQSNRRFAVGRGRWEWSLRYSLISLCICNKIEWEKEKDQRGTRDTLSPHSLPFSLSLLFPFFINIIKSFFR